MSDNAWIRRSVGARVIETYEARHPGVVTHEVGDVVTVLRAPDDEGMVQILNSHRDMIESHIPASMLAPAL